jgi:protein gp37
MAENSNIEWCDHTFNPWVGCTKVSPGCDHCYAEGWAKRAGRAAGVTWGGERRRTSPKNWLQPLRWNTQAKLKGRRFRVFCASLADVFDNQVPPEWREDLFALIRATPQLDWLLLTKRIGNAPAMIQQAIANFDIGYTPAFAAWPWPNVWIGATVTDQAETDRDIPKLRQVHAAVRFLSIEPLLGPVDLFTEATIGARANVADVRLAGEAWVDWVIVGGESGPGARPMHPDWARNLRDQCATAGVPFLFKQWGEHAPTERTMAEVQVSDTKHVPVPFSTESFYPCALLDRVGKKAAGRLLDGRTHEEFPQ